MATGWRLIASRWRESALDGVGASLYGGRWNPPGLRCVYLAGSAALATLELLVHLGGREPAEPFILLEVDLPDGIVGDPLLPDALPANWRHYPAPSELADLGRRWIESAASAVLPVPSVVVPGEFNYLLNPQLETARLAVVRAETRFDFDRRLFPDRVRG